MHPILSFIYGCAIALGYYFGETKVKMLHFWFFMIFLISGSELIFTFNEIIYGKLILFMCIPVSLIGYCQRHA